MDRTEPEDQQVCGCDLLKPVVVNEQLVGEGMVFWRFPYFDRYFGFQALVFLVVKRGLSVSRQR